MCKLEHKQAQFRRGQNNAPEKGTGNTSGNLLWGTDHDVLGGGTIQAAELLYIWEKTWVVGRFVDVDVAM